MRLPFRRHKPQQLCPCCGEPVPPQLCGQCWVERNWKWLSANPRASTTATTAEDLP